MMNSGGAAEFAGKLQTRTARRNVEHHALADDRPVLADHQRWLRSRVGGGSFEVLYPSDGFSPNVRLIQSSFRRLCAVVWRTCQNRSTRAAVGDESLPNSFMRRSMS